MQLVYLINGRAERIIKANAFDSSDIDAVKIDEKELTYYKNIIRNVKKSNYISLYFGCIDLDLQRFHFFMMLYIFLTTRDGGIIDELGNKINFSIPSFIFRYLPMFILELFVSGFVVIYHYIKLPAVKWKWLRAK